MAMNDGGDGGLGKYHVYVVIAGAVAATLTLVAAVIGLVTVLADDDGSPKGSAPVAPITSTNETGGGSEVTSGGSAQGGEGALDPAHDGNSRATAKRLPANRPIYSSIAAGNDEDWYVYEASKDETTTVEVGTAGEEAIGRLLDVELSEGLEEIDSSEDATQSYPFVVRWAVTAGTRLFVRVGDICEELGGCSIGAYKVIVRTSPPG